jgi:hypothetical protein
MKCVQITYGKKQGVAVLDWDNKLVVNCDPFGLKVGDDLSVHYRNHKDEYQYENTPIYTAPYHPKESLDRLLNKNSKLNALIQKFDLVLSV